MKIEEYFIIAEDSSIKLNRIVNKYIEHSYQPFGSVSPLYNQITKDVILFQAMVKYCDD